MKAHDRVELFTRVTRRRLALRKQWFWRLVAENNKIVMIAGEGFASAYNAERNFDLVCQTLGATHIPPIERV